MMLDFFLLQIDYLTVFVHCSSLTLRLTKTDKDLHQSTWKLTLRVQTAESVFAGRNVVMLDCFLQVSDCDILRQPNWKIFVCSANWLSGPRSGIRFSRKRINNRLLLRAFVSVPSCK